MKKLFLTLFLILFIAPLCWAAGDRPDSKKGMYWVSSLAELITLDKIGATAPNYYNLIEGDTAVFVQISGTATDASIYVFDATATDSTASPDILRPTSYTDGGVWRLTKMTMKNLSIRPNSVIELGHQDDTTLSRLAAGVLGVNGNSVPEGPASGPITFTGPSTARSYALPDSAQTIAVLGSAQTFNSVKTFSSSPVMSGAATVMTGVATLAGNPAMTAARASVGNDGVLFEGTTADNFEGLLTWPITVVDKTITLPDATGTVALTSNLTAGALNWYTTGTITGKISATTASGNRSLATAEYNGGTVVCTATAILTLPTAAAGLSGCVEAGQGVTAAIGLTSAANDYIVYMGARSPTTADTLTSPSTAGDRICYRAYDDVDWYVTTTNVFTY